MMRAFLAFLFLASTAFGQSITIAPTHEPYQLITASVDVDPAKFFISWEMSLDWNREEVGNSVYFCAPPGSWRLAVKVTELVDGKIGPSKRTLAGFVVKGTPVVPPGPVTPPVIPPVTPTKLTAIIVHETEDDSPAFARLAVGLRNPNGSAAKWMKSQGHKLLICDDDSVDETGQPSQVVANLKSLGVQMPFVAFLDDKSEVRATKVIDQDESDGTATMADNLVEWMRQQGG